MSDAAREAYDIERKINEAKKNFEKLCKSENKPTDRMHIALRGFFINREVWSVDEITSRMNQQPNPIYHVSKDLVQSYITYMTLNGILIMTDIDKYKLGPLDNFKAYWGS